MLIELKAADGSEFLVDATIAVFPIVHKQRRNHHRKHELPARAGRHARPTVQDIVRVRSTAQIAGHPIHPMLVPIPIACFIGALLTDIAYLVSAEMMWANFSAWLLLVGVIFGVLAAIAGLTDFLGNRLVRAQAPAWPHLLGNLVAMVLATINLLIHTRDAWTSVWPWGLVLSVLTVLILPVTGWLGWAMVYRHGVGVAR
jgi:uncharacterized membrane protein